jgi:hypothetical protein
MKKLSGMMAALSVMLVIACNEPVVQTEDLLSNPEIGYRSQMTMDVYHDGDIYTVNMYELSEKAAESIIEHGNADEIYTTCDLDEECDLLPIIDSVPGDGYNPLWQEIEIEFNVTPYQLTSEEEIDAAVEAGDITLIETDEVYRCAVIGKKH